MDLHGKIINIPRPAEGDLVNSHAYRIGHRDARHAAAELAAAQESDPFSELSNAAKSAILMVFNAPNDMCMLDVRRRVLEQYGRPAVAELEALLSPNKS